MKNFILIALMLSVIPCAAHAECGDGYHTGIVIKVLDQDVSARGGAKPLGAQQSAQQKNDTATLRTIIFTGNGSRYELQLPAVTDNSFAFANNDQLCFKVENKKVLVATTDGKTLPTTAKVLPRLPRK